MQFTIKAIWIIAVIVIIASMLWFLLASTAAFQRGIDIVTTFIYVFVWIPALIFVSLSFILIKRRWYPNGIVVRTILPLAIISVTCLLSIILFSSVHVRGYTKGWLSEIVDSDYTQVTPDGKYKYRIDIINMFQNNSSARLYMENVLTGEIISFPVNIATQEIITVSKRRAEPRVDEVWVKLDPTETENIYYLTTTDNLKERIEEFEINIEAKTVKDSG
jgi:hypothetical protein